MESRTLITAAVLLGLGLGGFFDGIVLHQILQWHHMGTSAGYPPTTLENLQRNTLWDGLFHAFTYLLTGAGIGTLWQAGERRDVPWSGKIMAGGLLSGWGLFNVVEGILNHHFLGLHHVNETVPIDQWLYWDMGFLFWGGLMLLGGWRLIQRGRAHVRVARESSL